MMVNELVHKGFMRMLNDADIMACSIMARGIATCQIPPKTLLGNAFASIHKFRLRQEDVTRRQLEVEPAANGI